MLLTMSLLFLSNVALTKSAPRAKPRVSSVFSIHVCQRGVQDCNEAKTGTPMDHLTFADTAVKVNRAQLTPYPGRTGETYLFGPNETFQQFVLSVLEPLIQTGHSLLNQSPNHVIIYKTGKIDRRRDRWVMGGGEVIL